VKLNEISLMESASLVDHLVNKRIIRVSMKRCTKEHFIPIIDYKPKFLTLVKGWMAWITRLVENVDKLLLFH
jgi:uncharacterized Fe-S cluster-containing radical SAM superfamily protein